MSKEVLFCGICGKSIIPHLFKNNRNTIGFGFISLKVELRTLDKNIDICSECLMGVADFLFAKSESSFENIDQNVKNALFNLKDLYPRSKNES